MSGESVNEREQRESTPGDGEDTVTPVQGRIPGLRSLTDDLHMNSEDEGLSPDRTPIPQVYYLLPGPTPDTPPPNHPAAGMVPAPRTSPPPSPSSFRPRNLNDQLLAAATADDRGGRGCAAAAPLEALSTTSVPLPRAGGSGGDEVCRSVPPSLPAPRLPVSMPAVEGAPSRRVPSQAQSGTTAERDVDGDAPSHVLGADGPFWVSEAATEGECIQFLPTPDLEEQQPEPLPAEQQLDGWSGLQEAAAEAAGLGDAGIPVLTGGDLATPPDTPLKGAAADDDVAAAAGAGGETEALPLAPKEDAAAEAAAVLPEGGCAAAEAREALLGSAASPSGLQAEAPAAAAIGPPAAAKAPTPAATPVKAAVVPHTPARRPGIAPKGKGATPGGIITPGTDRRPAPRGRASTGSAAAAGGGGASTGRPRQRRNVFPAMTPVASPRTPVPAKDPLLSPEASGRRGAAQPISPTATKAVTSPGEAGGAAATPRYAAPTAASLARLARETEVRGGAAGAARLTRQPLSMRLPASPREGGAGATPPAGGRRQAEPQRQSMVVLAAPEVR